MPKSANKHKLTTPEGRKALGSVLCDARQGKASQAEIAERLGVAQPHICSIEKGNNVVPLDALFDLADAYELPIVSLLTRWQKKVGK